jgi:hypothetical protein
MELLERERCLADLAQWLHAAAKHGGCVAKLGVPSRTAAAAMARAQSGK